MRRLYVRSYNCIYLLCVSDIDVLVVWGPFIIKAIAVGDVPPPSGPVRGGGAVVVDVRKVTPLPLCKTKKRDEKKILDYSFTFSLSTGRSIKILKKY